MCIRDSFAILSISLLGNQVAMIVSFISDRHSKRREQWQKKFEDFMHREADRLRPEADLLEEMALVHQINEREEL